MAQKYTKIDSDNIMGVFLDFVLCFFVAFRKLFKRLGWNEY